MENAYSKETERILSAEEACELYWIGEITDTQLFTCKEEGCEARVTLSSLPNRQKVKQSIHFRCYGEHKPGCPGISEKQGKTEPTESGGSENRIISSNMDILNLEPKKNVVIGGGAEPGKLFDPDSVKRRYRDDGGSKGRRNAEYRTLFPIVNKFLENEDDERTLKSLQVENQGKAISYREMFKPIKGGNYNPTMFYRIFYGNATISKVNGKDGHYRVWYKNTVTYDGNVYKPSAYFSSKIIDGSFRNRIWYDLLERCSNEKLEVRVFVYGRLETNNAGEKEYLNVTICKANIDLADIRDIERI